MGRCRDSGETLSARRPGTRNAIRHPALAHHLLRLGGGARGDLYLRVNVEVPRRLSADEWRPYEQLRELGKKGKR